MSLRHDPGRLRASATAALDYVAASPLAPVLMRVATRLRGGEGFVVLTYHRIGGGGDAFFRGIEVAAFRRQMELLAASWRVLPVSELLAGAATGSVPRNAAAVTFDDNYASVHEQALPVLRELGIPATMFVPTAPLDDGGQPLWYDRVLHAFKHATRRVVLSGIPGLEQPLDLEPEARYAAVGVTLAWMKVRPEAERLAALAALEEALVPLPFGDEPGHRTASWEQLRAWRDAGLGIGAHTVSHPILRGLPPERLRQELGDARRTLERGLEMPVRTLAYPNGGPEDFDPMVEREVEAAGYEAAFTTIVGLNRGSWPVRRYSIRRLDAAETDARRLMLRLAAIRLAA